jgi:hypothetical protein
MTRTDKIMTIKNSNVNDIAKNIDLHLCSDEEINKLHTIVANQKKGIARSASEWQLVNELSKTKSSYTLLGKWS